MKEEHFGIGRNYYCVCLNEIIVFLFLGVVECMAAGTITLAHNSGGPKEDIIVPYRGEKTGFLAETIEQYYENLMLIYNLSSKQRDKIRNSAREHVKKFSQNNFNDSFLYSFKKDCLDKFEIFKEEKHD